MQASEKQTPYKSRRTDVATQQLLTCAAFEKQLLSSSVREVVAGRGRGGDSTASNKTAMKRSDCDNIEVNSPT